MQRQFSAFACHALFPALGISYEAKKFCDWLFGFKFQHDEILTWCNIHCMLLLLFYQKTYMKQQLSVATYWRSMCMSERSEIAFVRLGALKLHMRLKEPAMHTESILFLCFYF